MKKHYESAVQRLEHFLVDATGNEGELHAELESQGVDVAAFQARLERIKHAQAEPATAAEPTPAGETFARAKDLKNLAERVDTIADQNSKMLEIIQRKEERVRVLQQVQQQQKLIWELVHGMAHTTRDLIADRDSGEPQEQALLNALFKFCNDIVELLKAWPDHRFQVSVAAFTSGTEAVIIATDEAAFSRKTATDHRRNKSAPDVQSVARNLTMTKNIFTTNNHIFVGIRRVQARLARPELIGFLTIECLTARKRKRNFFQDQEIEGNLKNMLLAYADVVFGILTLQKSGRAAHPVAGGNFSIGSPAKIKAIRHTFVNFSKRQTGARGLGRSKTRLITN